MKKTIGFIGMGNMAQVNTIASAVVDAVPGLHPKTVALLTGLAAAVPVAMVRARGSP